MPGQQQRYEDHGGTLLLEPGGIKIDIIFRDRKEFWLRKEIPGGTDTGTAGLLV